MAAITSHRSAQERVAAPRLQAVEATPELLLLLLRAVAAIPELLLLRAVAAIPELLLLQAVAAIPELLLLQEGAQFHQCQCQ
mgnify:CR=1 FL=1